MPNAASSFCFLLTVRRALLLGRRLWKYYVWVIRPASKRLLPEPTKTLFFLFSFSFLLFTLFSSGFPAKSSKSQELWSIVCNIVTINHCIRTQQIHITLGFQRGRRSRLFATFLSTFSRRAATGSSASTSTLARFPYLTRFMTGRLWKYETIWKGNAKVNKP